MVVDCSKKNKESQNHVDSTPISPSSNCMKDLPQTMMLGGDPRLVPDVKMLENVVVIVNNSGSELRETSTKLEANGIPVVMIKENIVAYRLLTGAYPRNESLRYTCNSCGSVISDVSLFNMHPCISYLSPNRERQLFPCARCKKVFTTGQALGNHKKQHFIDEFTCFECNESFENLQAKGGHLSMHKKQKENKKLQEAHREITESYSLLKTAYKELLSNHRDLLLKIEEEKKIAGKLVLLLTHNTMQTLHASSFLNFLNTNEISIPSFIMLQKTELAFGNKYLEEGAAGVLHLPLEDEDILSIKKHFLV